MRKQGSRRSGLVRQTATIAEIPAYGSGGRGFEPVGQPGHYPTPRAKCADLVVHLIGLAFAILGGGVLLGLSMPRGDPGLIVSVSVYVLGLIGMLGCSTAYNFARPGWRPLLRRFDHAGIFVMIAGSYTPFTTQTLTGAWAWAMTLGVWILAILGAVGKLLMPAIGARFWGALYFGLGACVVIAFWPMAARGSWLAILLLAVGGALYVCGAVFYLRKTLGCYRAVWHGHVVAAAGIHWSAVLVGVVLASAG